MPKVIKQAENEYKFPDDIAYSCKLIDVVEREIAYFKRNEHGERTNTQDTFKKWEWHFEVQEGPYMGQILYGETRPEYTTREDNKVRQWSEALLNRELAVGEELDTDTLLGRQCVVSVRHDPPRPKKDGGMFYPTAVDEVVPKSGSLLTTQPPF